MIHTESHVLDGELLLHLDGELSPIEEKRVSSHIAACWRCRTRCQRMEQAIEDFVDVYQGRLCEQLPPADGPRALLRARMAELTSSQVSNRRLFKWGILSTALVSVLVLGYTVGNSMTKGMRAMRTDTVVVTVPNTRLTPGATVLVSRSAVCAQASTNNKPVPVALQRAVFREYGIPSADPKAYEVDYLITPALGGADDIHNLWPHSYSATVWNARRKDALESRLREMVCNGSLELADAQREIAENWIAAYKKYFNTDQPLEVR